MRLRAQGERLAGLTYLMASRLREALAIALRLQAGESAAEVRRGLRMPPRAAERFVKDVAQTEPERLRAALGRAGGPGARYARRLTAAGGPLADVGAGGRDAGAARDRIDRERINERADGQAKTRTARPRVGGRRGTCGARRCSCASRRA